MNVFRRLGIIHPNYLSLVLIPGRFDEGGRRRFEFKCLLWKNNSSSFNSKTWPCCSLMFQSFLCRAFWLSDALFAQTLNKLSKFLPNQAKFHASAFFEYKLWIRDRPIPCFWRRRADALGANEQEEDKHFRRRRLGDFSRWMNLWTATMIGRKCCETRAKYQQQYKGIHNKNEKRKFEEISRGRLLSNKGSTGASNWMIVKKGVQK